VNEGETMSGMRVADHLLCGLVLPEIHSRPRE